MDWNEMLSIGTNYLSFLFSPVLSHSRLCLSTVFTTQPLGACCVESTSHDLHAVLWFGLNRTCFVHLSKALIIRQLLYTVFSSRSTETYGSLSSLFDIKQAGK
jgi:hypothetical protein